MKPRFRQPHAFSLIEVVLALGIISFCLMSLIGLLSLGLGTIAYSRERAGSANSLELIANSLRQAISTNATYQASGAYSNISWTTTAPISTNMNNISLAAVPTSVAEEQRLAAHVKITPPASSGLPTTACISVAWPRYATYNDATASWSNAQGFVSTWLIFVPGQ